MSFSFSLNAICNHIIVSCIYYSGIYESKTFKKSMIQCTWLYPTLGNTKEQWATNPWSCKSFNITSQNIKWKSKIKLKIMHFHLTIFVTQHIVGCALYTLFNKNYICN